MSQEIQPSELQSGAPFNLTERPAEGKAEKISENTEKSLEEPSEQPQDLAKALAEAEHYRQSFLRTLADLENYRRRVIKEKEEWSQSTIGSTLSDLLPIVDHFSMGLQAAQKHTDVGEIVKGFQMVYDQLLKFLESKEIKVIEAESNTFDPQWHECIAYIPNESIPEGHVVQVIRPGYSLMGKLLRAASVVVSSGKPKATEGAAS